MAPPPPRELVDDVIPEILLRLPPDDPKWLFRAALACKPWLRTISDPAFLRRYRAFHGYPPLLGLIDMPPRFVATAAVPAFPIPPSDTPYTFPVDCRHGRVLIHNFQIGDRYGCYLVYDPITGDHHHVPYPDVEIGIDSVLDSTVIVATAIFCAVTGCRHLDCHGGPFCVSLMFIDLFSPTTMWATVYSSEMGAWSTVATLGNVGEAYGRGALLGEGIYFPLRGNAGIVEYDWGKNRLAVVQPPPLAIHDREEVALTVTKDSSLGLAAIQDSSLCLWSRVVSSVQNVEWIQYKVIDLGKMMPMANPNDGAYVVGAAEGVGVFFISTNVGLFMIELNSGRAEKVGKPCHNTKLSVIPYMSFYTPDRCRLPLQGGHTDL